MDTGTCARTDIVCANRIGDKSRMVEFYKQLVKEQKVPCGPGLDLLPEHYKNDALAQLDKVNAERNQMLVQSQQGARPGAVPNPLGSPVMHGKGGSAPTLLPPSQFQSNKVKHFSPQPEVPRPPPAHQGTPHTPLVSAPSITSAPAEPGMDEIMKLHRLLSSTFGSANPEELQQVIAHMSSSSNPEHEMMAALLRKMLEA
ncbi:hypothetical protein Ciccas_004296, partial [Cichlidogyrus casuarinus]